MRLIYINQKYDSREKEEGKKVAARAVFMNNLDEGIQ